MAKRMLALAIILLITLSLTLLYYARASRRDEVLEGLRKEVGLRDGADPSAPMSEQPVSMPTIYEATTTAPIRAPTSDFSTEVGGLKYDLLNPATFINKHVFTVSFLVEGRHVAVVVKPGKNGAARVLVCSPPNKDGSCKNRVSATLVSGVRPTKEKITVIDAGITTSENGPRAAIMYKAGIDHWVVLLQPGGPHGFKSAAVCQPSG